MSMTHLKDSVSCINPIAFSVYYFPFALVVSNGLFSSSLSFRFRRSEHLHHVESMADIDSTVNRTLLDC